MLNKLSGKKRPGDSQGFQVQESARGLPEQQAALRGEKIFRVVES